MFGFLKDNKPEIKEKIYEAIKEEEKFIQSVGKDIKNNLDTFVSNTDIASYVIEVECRLSNNFYEKKEIFVENASSREMFQALNSISSDAQYDEKNDYASGTVNGYTILMNKSKVLGKSLVSLQAKLHIGPIENSAFVRRCVDKYKLLNGDTKWHYQD
jgi:hypothetical protein